MSEKKFTEKEKSKILQELDEERVLLQKQKELEKKRTNNKKIYKIGSKKCYKFLNMEREYYLDIEECKKISSKARLITLYYKTFDEVKRKTYLMKTQVYSDKFFISDDPIRVYFKEYTLENDK
ncbi:MAG TPA: hypothetical protein ENK98_01700 [Epsilonproteobacteria bacterium]|nr:hypothetical protein [Campylobacterota bacterium]